MKQYKLTSPVTYSHNQDYIKNTVINSTTIEVNTAQNWRTLDSKNTQITSTKMSLSAIWNIEKCQALQHKSPPDKICPYPFSQKLTDI